ncbi:MAG TPA: hypothetical protein PKZ76_14985, partial [Xanthomonadaceae bacterium]|nr:hypothetical protein [Xanthomonadaceae bacterium]
WLPSGAGSEPLTTTEPGASAAYLIEVRNAGPDQAVNVTLGTTSTPALEGPAWTCVGVDGGICPNPAGSGEIGETISLAAGAGLDYVLSGTVPDDVGPQQELTAGVLSDPSAPNFVHDTNAANDLSVDINVVEGIFADGFED